MAENAMYVVGRRGASPTQVFASPVGASEKRMPILVIIPAKNSDEIRQPKQLIVDFDPTTEAQADVEHEYGVSFSQYYATKEEADQVLARTKTDSFR
jgi:hypothetical protein